MRCAPLLLLLACEDGPKVSLADDDWGLGSSEEDCVSGFIDLDGDGYGGTPAELCDGSVGLPDEDCDDTDPALNPGDHTCGLQGEVRVEDAAAVVRGGEPDWGIGGNVGEGGDLDGDGVPELLIGSTQATAPGGVEESGAVYVFRGPVLGNRPTSSAETTIAASMDAEQLGGSVAGPGDLDGDGYDDILLGTNCCDELEHSPVWLLRGPLPDGSLPSSDAELLRLGQDSQLTLIASAGDLDDDGLTDLAFGFPYATGSRSGTGLALLLLAPSGPVDDLEAEAQAIVEGATGGDDLGADIDGQGDADGDGWPDLLIGVTGLDGDEHVASAGGIYLFSGPLSGTLTAGEATATRLGPPDDGFAKAGGSVAFAGDVDGDGYDDLLVGSESAEQAWLLLGPVEGPGYLSEATATFVPGAEGSAGDQVTGGDDLDGDGRDDYLISGARLAHLFYEPVEGTVNLSAAHATLNVGIAATAEGEEEDVRAGLALLANADGAGRPGALVVASEYVDGWSDAAFLYLGW